MEMKVQKSKGLRGTVTVPGDKSISHRAVMLGALAEGETRISGFLQGEDCLSTISCFRKLGVEIEQNGSLVKIQGVGLQGLREAEDFLDVGNSGTTLRLISGILAGQSFTTFLTGDASIRRRPMRRIIEPLEKMGAVFMSRNNLLAPLAVRGGKLKSIHYALPVASAQVKSALLLAGLYAGDGVVVEEKEATRNHSELMLSAFGAKITSDAKKIKLEGHPTLRGQQVEVPGDISSAAFLVAAGAIIPDSELKIENIGLNPTRTGMIDVLDEMGADYRIANMRTVAGEIIGDIGIKSSELRSFSIGGKIIPRLIDEIPILAVMAAFAQGTSEIRDAAELKVKESNRLLTITRELSKMGVQIEELSDGLRIKGGKPLQGAHCLSYNDHRIAMSLAIAGLQAEGETIIEEAGSVAISFPGFSDLLKKLEENN